MCQLFGSNANTPHDIVFSFTGFSVRAKEHKDGFGVSFFENRGVRSFVDTQSAQASPVAGLLRTTSIKSANVIAHIRKATQGVVALENCHPFVRQLWGYNWVFAHNGDLKEYHPHLHGSFRPIGDTDSERAFCWLLQELNKSHAALPALEELAATLRELVPQIAAHGTFNMLLSNGAALWSHCSTNLYYRVRQHPFSVATLQDEDLSIDFSQHASPEDRVAVIATEPLTLDEQWTRMANGQIIAFVDGAVAFQASPPATAALGGQP